MKTPYPVDVVPLLQQFLGRRRTKLDHPLRAMEELGIDRPAFLRAVTLSEVAPDGATIDDLLFPYSTRGEMLRGMLAAGEGAGLVEERNGRFHATAKARDHARRLRVAARAHLESLEPIPLNELARLADLLERAFLASAAASPQVPHAHTPRAFRYRAENGSTHPMVVLDNAVYGLWMVRDDCHVAAWHGRDLRGPDLNVLTYLWRGEAETPEGLVSLLGHDTRARVDAALVELRARGLVEPEDPLRLTRRGRTERDRIETDTDRFFFEPWPDEVGALGSWIRDRLSGVNAALA